MKRLKVSDNQRFLVTEDGEPFFWLGDTAWELFHRCTRGDVQMYLDNRAAKGFNVVQAVVLAELDGLNTPNLYGDLPLIDRNPTQLNEPYFAFVDKVIKMAEERDIYIGLLPTWGDKVDSKVEKQDIIFNPENALGYGRLIGERYRDAPNIVWILGGDRLPDGDEAVWDAMAQGILEGTEGDALITYHPRGWASSSDKLHDRDWLHFNMLQSSHGDRDLANWEFIEKDYALTPTKPTFEGEPCYEDIPIGFKVENPPFTDYDIRKIAYRGVFAGGFGHTYGHNSVWQMYRPPFDPVIGAHIWWEDALDRPGAFQIGHLRHLMESRPFLNRIPDQSMLINPPNEAHLHVQATRADDGEYALIYIPTAEQTVEINLSSLRGDQIRATWYDPRNGTESALMSFPKSETYSFTTPESAPDWVLILDSV